jgi:hypothetical protein
MAPEVKHPRCRPGRIPRRIFSELGHAATLRPDGARRPAPEGFATKRYFALVEEGVLLPDDRVELLVGVHDLVPRRGSR